MYTSQFSSINDVTFSSPVAGVFHVIRPQSFHVCLRRRHGAGECGREAPPGPQILVIKKIRSAVPSPGSPGSAAAPRPSPLIHHYINRPGSCALHQDAQVPHIVSATHINKPLRSHLSCTSGIVLSSDTWSWKSYMCVCEMRWHGARISGVHYV